MNRVKKNPDSNTAMHNIAKVATMSDNVSKTVTIDATNNASSVIPTMAHDRMDFDQSISNNTLKSIASNDDNIGISGNLCGNMSSLNPVPDRSIHPSIMTSKIQNHLSTEQTCIMSLKQPPGIENDSKTYPVEKIPPLSSQRQQRK